MAKTSKYYQLNDYILLEYEYEDQGSPDLLSTSAAPFLKIVNNNTNQIQLLNSDVASASTKNVRDNSVVQVGDNEYAHMDVDLPLNYLMYDTNLTSSTLAFSPNINVVYDRIILHILSGYNFDNNIDGYILKIEALTSGIVPEKIILANIPWTSLDTVVNLNSDPIRIGQRVYDRNIDFKIPSMKWVNQQFYSNTSNPNTFGYVSTGSTNNKGYNATNPLYFTLFEIESTRIANRFRYFKTTHKKEISITQEDEFSDLGAVLKESDNGDYFEYYATYQNSFIEDYIFFLNNKGGNYILIHDLKVSEQIATETIPTFNMNSIQSSAYDKAQIFRPVIQNSHLAFAFHIDYLFRLYNQNDGSQIIRRASLSSYEPKKYGKELEKISLGYDPEIHKVYNQIKDGVIVQTPPIKITPTVDVKYVPTFYERNQINISNQTIHVDQDGKITSEANTGNETLYGQGQLELTLNPFDNLVKFKVHKKDKDGVLSFDLNGQNLQLIFVLGENSTKGKRLYIDEIKDSGTSNKADGELVFNINSDNVEKITQSKNKNFYIINKTNNGFQRPLFRGKWTTVEIEAEEDVLRKQLSDTKALLETEKKRLTDETSMLKTSLDKATQELEELKNKVITDLLNASKKQQSAIEASTATTDSLTASVAAAQLAAATQLAQQQILNFQPSPVVDNSVRPVNSPPVQVINTAVSDPAANAAENIKDAVKPKFFKKLILKIGKKKK